MTKYLKDILPLQQWLVKNKMSQSILTSEDDGLSEVSTIKLSKGEDGEDISIVVNKQCFRQLGVNQPLGENVIDAVACLFQLRDDRICESHKSVNSNKQNYQPFQRSKYVRASFWEALLQGMKSVDQLKEEYFGQDWNVENYLHVYIYVTSFDAHSVDPWALLQVNLVTHKIGYLDGRINGRAQPVPPELMEFLTMIRNVFQPLLSTLVPAFLNEWQCSVYRETYFELLDNQYDSGVYIAAFTYFLSVEVPLYFNHNSIVRLRMSFAYWILAGALPI